MLVPDVTLTHLNRADGSATYTHNGYSIIGAVTGPIEVLRRDEQPEEATIEVNIRPAAGVGSPKERHLETVVHSTLRSILLARQLPRTLVQITLQVRSLPEEDAAAGLHSSLALLPHLLHTALLALLSASIPLATTLSSILVALPAAPDDAPLVSPSADELRRAGPIKSAHVFAFTGDKRLLMDESDGSFSLEEWEEACGVAEAMCCKEEEEDEGGVKLEGMHVDGGAVGDGHGNLETWLRAVVRRKVEWEQRWKKGS